MKNFYIIVSENDKKSAKRAESTKNKIIESIARYPDTKCETSRAFWSAALKYRARWNVS